MSSVTGRPGRLAIITGGATVVFKELLDETVTTSFLRALADAGFETVIVQSGSYADEVTKKLAEIQDFGLDVQVKPFITNMKEVMKMARGLVDGRDGGLVISHAGTGTIADCWEVRVANVIVANPNLMDNHQAVFAEDTARAHPTVVLGRLGHLVEAIPVAMRVIQDEGLDNLEPFCEPGWPGEEDQMHFIDNIL